jgi:hypothetical protein
MRVCPSGSAARVLALVLAVVSAVAMLVSPRIARADQPGGHAIQVAVLAIDSEDAEDQADALTGALRSRIRKSQGWSLLETTASLGMLTAALKCPSKPTPECQQKIGEQLKAERYIWGTLSKGPTAGQVTAELHFYQKGKPDSVIKESYADNLKDQNDDTLGKIAQRVIDRLGGSSVGIVVVRSADQTGEVIVDGEKRVPLAQGVARIEVAPGSHSIEITGPSGSTKRTIMVTAGKETPVDVGPTPPPGGTEPEKPFPTKKVIGGAALAGGVILGVIAVQQLLLWVDLQDRGDEIAKKIPDGQKPCDDSNSNKEFCDTHHKAQASSAIAIGTGVGGALLIGAGVYFLFLSPDSAEKPTTGTVKKPRVIPTFGTNSGGVVLSGSF